MRNIILVLVMLIGLTGCGGGGDAPANESPSIPSESISLSPLQISLLDLDNKPIPYIDISKIGVHVVYKLKFTNNNKVSAKLVMYNKVIDYYAPAQNSWAYGRQYGDAIKTSNTDDCLNQETIPSNGSPWVELVPGASCSYYTYATNEGHNTSNNDMFTVPVDYTISNSELRLKLVVIQCSQSGFPPNPITYNCSNMSKPGFAEQFISYKMLPINGTSNTSLYDGYGINQSEDGNWLWNCDSYTCRKYALTYNSSANTLTKATDPTTTIGINSGGQHIEDLYPTFDGSSTWVSSYSNVNGYYLVNTANPGLLLTNNCRENHCVPNIDTTFSGSDGPSPGTRGADDSFWWNTGVSADVYDQAGNTFVATNIAAVYGVTADGVILGMHNGELGCFDRGVSYTSYTYRGPLLNYVQGYNPLIGLSGKNLYIRMEVPGIVSYVGPGQIFSAYYKIHTENGLCQINLDDYTYRFASNTQYLHITPEGYSTDFVTSIANVYSGLE